VTAADDVNRMTELQALRVADCVRQLRAENVTPVWHFNHCGCCVSVHADVEHVEYGYIVNRHGEAFWERCE
jgi:hypothetical protein